MRLYRCIAQVYHHMMIYSGEGLLQTDAVKARGIADFVLMSLSHCHRTRLQFTLQFRSGEFHGGQWWDGLKPSHHFLRPATVMIITCRMSPLWTVLILSFTTLISLDRHIFWNIILIFPLPFYTVVEKLKFPTVSRNFPGNARLAKDLQVFLGPTTMVKKQEGVRVDKNLQLQSTADKYVC